MVHAYNSVLDGNSRICGVLWTVSLAGLMSSRFSEIWWRMIEHQMLNLAPPQHTHILNQHIHMNTSEIMWTTQESGLSLPLPESVSFLALPSLISCRWKLPMQDPPQTQSPSCHQVELKLVFSIAQSFLITSFSLIWSFLLITWPCCTSQKQ